MTQGIVIAAALSALVAIPGALAIDATLQADSQADAAPRCSGPVAIDCNQYDGHCLFYVDGPLIADAGQILGLRCLWY